MRTENEQNTLAAAAAAAEMVAQAELQAAQLVDHATAEREALLADAQAEYEALRAEIHVEHEALQAELAAEREAILSAAEAEAARLRADAEAEYESILADADADAEFTRAQARRLAAETQAQIQAGGEQLVELMTLRERFSSTLRAIVDDFGREIDRVDHPGMPMTATMPWPALPLAELPAVTQPVPLVEAEQEGLGEPIALHIGPLRDYAAVAALERTLDALPQVMDVYVRRYSAERADVELTVAADLDVAAALESVLPQNFEIEPTAGGYHVELDVAQLAARHF